MQMPINRPLDYLDEFKDKQIKIVFKNKEIIEGTLKSFDIHINLIIDRNNDGSFIFVRGDEVFSIESNE